MARPRALVTGASSGIGAAFASQRAAAGHEVVVVEAVSNLEIDVLVNDAGFGAYRPFPRLDPPFPRLDPARARDLASVLALAPTLLTRAALPGMVERARGAIVNVASALAGRTTFPERTRQPDHYVRIVLRGLLPERNMARSRQRAVT